MRLIKNMKIGILFNNTRILRTSGWSLPFLCSSKNSSLLLNVGYTKVGKNETLPLAYLYHEIAYRLGLKMVQEIVWRYYGGMAYKLRYTHRTERILWFSKDPDNCTFNLDDVRVKEWQNDGKKLTSPPPRCNPRKKPTDVWEIACIRFNNKKEKYGASHVNFPKQ